MKLEPVFKVYSKEVYPKRKKHFFPETFKNKRGAMNFCKNPKFAGKELVVVHPQGKREPFVRSTLGRR